MSSCAEKCNYGSKRVVTLFEMLIKKENDKLKFSKTFKSLLIHQTTAFCLNSIRSFSFIRRARLNEKVVVCDHVRLQCFLVFFFILAFSAPPRAAQYIISE